MNSAQHINTAAALELLGGEAELYQELIEAYLAALPADINDVFALEQTDTPAAAQFVHRIKGSSLQIGAEALGAAGQVLEDALRGKSSGNIPALTATFIAEYTATVEEAKKLFNT